MKLSVQRTQDVFQLTRLMRGVTFIVLSCFTLIDISTHTPHARRDPEPSQFRIVSVRISTHTPHARRDGNT